MMKKSILVIFLLIGVLCLGGCKNNDNELNIDYDYVVTYDAVGGKMGNYDQRYLYVKEDSLIAEPGTSGLVNALLNGYTLQGWYTGEVLEDGSIKYLDKWDFKTNSVTSDLTLYARWQELYKYVYVYGVDNSLSRTISSHESPDALVSRPSTDPLWSGHTFIGYFEDKECTKTFEFNKAYDFVDGDGNPTFTYTIYTKWLDGVYKMVTQPTDMEVILENVNYYLTCDLDFTGITVQMPLNYAGTIEGNNYTISNLQMSYIRNNVTETDFGLFGKLDNATIRNLNFNNCSYKLNIVKTGTYRVGFLAGNVGSSKLENISITNCQIILITDVTNKEWCLYETGTPEASGITESGNEIVITNE